MRQSIVPRQTMLLTSVDFFLPTSTSLLPRSYDILHKLKINILGGFHE